MEAGERNSISNKAINSHCPSINDLLAALAASDWTSLSRLFSVSSQWPTDDDDSPGTADVLWKERDKERGNE